MEHLKFDVSKFKKAFDGVDKEKKGAIQMNQLVDLLTAMGYKYDMPYDDLVRIAKVVHVADIFKRWDTDGDGYLGPDEISAGFSGMGIKISEDAIKHILTDGDVDADGLLDRKELSDIV